MITGVYTSLLFECSRNNKQLQVQYATYRDKTEPGSNEKWTVTIQHFQQEKTAAELLTGMYDASLDQFKSNNWAIPYIWETNNQQNIFSAGSNFSVEIASENTVPEKYLEECREHDVCHRIFEFEMRIDVPAGEDLPAMDQEGIKQE